jgi:RNA polymerase sigma factor (sigma-70 family)
VDWLDLDWLYIQAAQRLPVDVADDVVQETALAAWQMSGTRQQAGVRTWLNGILRHKVADHYRRERVPLVELQPWHYVQLADETVVVRMMMGELPYRYALVLWLRFWAGMTFAECGEMMGCSMDAAKSVYRRAICAARRWWLC